MSRAVIGETITFAFPQGSFLSNGEWYEPLCFCGYQRVSSLPFHDIFFVTFVAEFS